MSKAMNETSERGAAGVEYGIMIAAIAAVIVLVAYAVGLKVLQGFQLLDTLWT